MSRITIQVDYPRVYRNKTEYRTQPRATWVEGGLSVQGNGYVIRQVLQKAADSGADMNATVCVLSGIKPLFRPLSLQMWVNPPDRSQRPLNRAKIEGSAE